MARVKHIKIKKTNARKSASGTFLSPVVSIARTIDPLTRLFLFVRAGGRCQFDGCNKYLLEHHVTLTEGNFAQIGHVVAFREDGPRGKGSRPQKINGIDNLMLLCPECHHLIDTQSGNFTRQTLEGYKRQHDQRIFHVTGLGPEQKSSLLIVKSKIGDQTVAIPYDQILQAITPRYPISKEGLPIDLTQLPAKNDSFIKAACATISAELQSFFASGGEFKKSGHISLFALAPIPILVFLGSQLSNKVPLDLYQRHRDTEDWSWKDAGPPVLYDFNSRRSGGGSGVALLLSLSGPIADTSLPPEITKDYSLYELTLATGMPNTTFLRTRRDLEEFRVCFQIAIATIVREHPGLKQIDLFPAVPAPIAVLCGRELLPKVHPALRVFDFDKRSGGFVYQLDINT